MFLIRNAKLNFCNSKLNFKNSMETSKNKGQPELSVYYKNYMFNTFCHKSHSVFTSNLIISFYLKDNNFEKIGI